MAGLVAPQRPRLPRAAPPVRAAPRADAGRHRPATTFEGLCADLVERELHRLQRRIPALDPATLHTVEATLQHILDRLLLARVRACPVMTQHLATVFGLDGPGRRDATGSPVRTRTADTSTTSPSAATAAFAPEGDHHDRQA